MIWHSRQRFRGGRQRRFRAALPVGEAELPVIDVSVAAIPFVGPRIDERAGTAAGKRGANLPGERLRLRVFAIAEAVETQFAHHQRPVIGHVVQAGDVGVEFVLGL